MHTEEKPTGAPDDPGRATDGWAWPLDLKAYDLDPELSWSEVEALRRGGPVKLRRSQSGRGDLVVQPPELRRFAEPFYDAVRLSEDNRLAAARAAGAAPGRGPSLSFSVLWRAVVDRMRRTGRSYREWADEEWAEFFVHPGRHPSGIPASNRCHFAAAAYLLGSMRYVVWYRGCFHRLATRVFGHERVAATYAEVERACEEVGIATSLPSHARFAVGYLMLVSASPNLADADAQALDDTMHDPRASRTLKTGLYKAVTALHKLGIVPERPNAKGEKVGAAHFGRHESVRRHANPEWHAWCRRWHAASPERGRMHKYHRLTRVGLWLAEQHPEVKGPQDWDWDVCRSFVAMVSDMRISQYVIRPLKQNEKRRGEPVKAWTKAKMLSAVRTFFWDLQRLGWIEARFNPARALESPKAFKTSSLPPEPRDIDEKVWLKLVWAALNLEREDLPAGTCKPAGSYGAYPFEMIKAMAVVWTHAGLRKNEIRRLRLGCVRPQTEPIESESGGEQVAPGTICYLSVPFSKQSPAYVKPVSAAVEQAISAWIAVRPPQPLHTDRTTGERVDFLFSNRGHPVSDSYLGRKVIPLLCQKAGVPREDSKERITPHRARSSAVTMLANSRHQMSDFDLMRWCGHTSPSALGYYLRRREHKLAAAFAKADESSHLIEVLVDQEAVLDGSAAAGEPWKYYDLGDSYCTYLFWSQCQHRLACSRCSFNVPKGSAEAGVIEAKVNLARFLESVPLSDEERAAVEGDAAVLERLLSRLKGTKAPDGNAFGGQKRAEGLHELAHPLPVLTAADQRGRAEPKPDRSVGDGC
jgi:hypothetical protein